LIAALSPNGTHGLSGLFRSDEGSLHSARVDHRPVGFGNVDDAKAVDGGAS
jgi:hypothetical protein